MNLCAHVRSAVKSVAAKNSLVRINVSAIEKEVAENKEFYSKDSNSLDWHQDFHYVNAEDAELQLRYILLVDSLNFCFWPLEGYEYCHLAGGLKRVVELDSTAINPENLVNITENQLSQWLLTEFRNKTAEIPLIQERCRLVHETASRLLEKFDGSVVNLVRAANRSAVSLVTLIYEIFYGFQDHCIYRGKQVHFLKRAQIFVGDVWGAFQGSGLSDFQFSDISELTCFADYRVPQILLKLGILEYRNELLRKVRGMVEICPGSEEEVSIRSATVHAVELLRKRLNDAIGGNLNSVEIDWILWNRGEAALATGSMEPHHRVLTIYY